MIRLPFRRPLPSPAPALAARLRLPALALFAALLCGALPAPPAMALQAEVLLAGAAAQDAKPDDAKAAAEAEKKARNDRLAAACRIDGLRDCVDAIADSANDALVRLLARVPQLILAILVVLIAHWLSRFVGNRLHLLRIKSQNPYMSGLVRTVIRTAVLLVGVLIALDLIGLTSVVGAVLGSAGVVGLVLGFAFRDIAENYIASILLSVRRPFEPGDHVLVENREGKVISVNSRATVLMTLDGNHLQLPNSMVFKSVVLNYTKNPKRRFDFSILIDPGQSIRVSQTLAMAEIARIEGVLVDPAPSWTVAEYGAAGIQLRFYGWVDQSVTDLGKVRSEAIRLVKASFAKAGIEGPRTTYHIVSARAKTTAEAMPPPEEESTTTDASLDTSVNREIDTQVVEARQDAAAENLLNHKSN